MLQTTDVPFEIWHTIFRDVYSDFDAFPNLDDPRYVLSPLHKRLLIHRTLSSVSKHLHELSSSVFLEELHLSNPESLLEVARIVTKDPNLGRVVRKLSLNFHDYRCGASSPRRDRELKPRPADEEPFPPDNDPQAQAVVRRQLSMDMAARQARARYSPSGTRQPQHWLGWVGFARTIIAACTGVSEVSINATSDYSQHLQKRSGRNYRSLFGSPDLNNMGMLSGLIAASNLQVLHLVDPSPLDEFGSALSQWPMLREVDITVTAGYPEARRLSEAEFIPPKHLEKFTLMNRSQYISSLPTRSDLSRCPSLTSLTLGVLNLSDTATVLAAQFLVDAYQHSLVHLTLDVRKGVRDVTALLKHGALHFPALESLVVHGGTCHVSLFSVLQAPALEEIEFRSMDVERTGASDALIRATAPPNPHAGLTADALSTRVRLTQTPAYWIAFFSQPTLAKLKAFRVQVVDPRVKEVMRRVAAECGIDPGESVALHPAEQFAFPNFGPPPGPIMGHGELEVVPVGGGPAPQHPHAHGDAPPMFNDDDFDDDAEENEDD